MGRGVPPREHYGLSRERRRAAISVGSNLADGRGRRSDAECARFLDIALGSARELGFQWRLARALGYANDAEVAVIEELIVG